MVKLKSRNLFTVVRSNTLLKTCRFGRNKQEYPEIRLVAGEKKRKERVKRQHCVKDMDVNFLFTPFLFLFISCLNVTRFAEIKKPATGKQDITFTRLSVHFASNLHRLARKARN